MFKFKNRRIFNAKLTEDCFYFYIPILRNYFDGWEDFDFIITKRDSDARRAVTYQVIDQTEKYFIFEVMISVTEHLDFIQDEGIISLSILRSFEDEEKILRIKSNREYIELLQFETTEGYIIHPFTTRSGNISMNYREKYLFSRIHHASITNDGKLDIRGLYHTSIFKNANIKQMKLYVTTNLYEEEEYIEIPLLQQSLPYAYSGKFWFDDLKENGFATTIDLKPFYNDEQSGFLKFYLAIEFEKNDSVEEIVSGRLKLQQLLDNPVTEEIVKGKSYKVRMTVRATDKSKYLSVRVGEYKFVEETVKEAKRQWIKIRRSKQALKLYKSAFNILSKVIKSDKRLVVFESFHGKQYSDNPRAIYEYMREHCPEYKLVWSADRRHVNLFKDLKLPYERRFSIRWLLTMSRAEHWVTNARLPLWIPKPKKTKYLQTWHGTPLKRLATDMEEVQMPGTNTEKYKRNFITETSKWDYLVSPNAYSTEIFKRAFQFDRTMIESGYPRNDYLYQMNNAEEINRLKDKMGIDSDKKVILYAPTWRDNQFYRKGQYKFDLEMDLDRFQEEFGETHVIILRMHYLVAENLDIGAYEGFVYDFSKYEDIRDLYLVADYLITDYSSVFFDYANLERPMLFFVYDIEDYRDNLRGFYFDFEKKAPGPLVKESEQLLQEIKKIEEEGFHPSEEFKAFVDRFCYLEDGHASKRVVKEVFQRN